MPSLRFPKNPTPAQLLKMYQEGLPGADVDLADTDRLLGELPHPLFGPCAATLAGSGEGKLSMPYLSLERFDPKIFSDEKQTTGDCTSHGCRNAHAITQAVEIHIKREPESYDRSACEAIYGYRGHGGKGMSPSAASRFVNKYGMLKRAKYGAVDLRVYNASYGINWGRHGIPQAILDACAKHPVRTISLVTSVEEARDAAANGYGMHIGSNQGFSSRRDSDGFCRASGSWSHDMGVGGCDFRSGKRHGFLIINSWGKWCSGGSGDWGTLPDGTFMCDVNTFARMLRGHGCWAFSDTVGFPPRKLPDYGSLSDVLG